MNPESSPPSSELIAPFTAFPNVLLDALMPELKDTEWRLLCVIVRQTIGWSMEGGRRKDRDWLTQRQLMARTGRNSAALSAALDALVCRRLVNAWNETGELLLTPLERRRYQGRIYFGLCREALSGLAESSSKTPLRNVNRTKETQYQKKSINEEREIGSNGTSSHSHKDSHCRVNRSSLHAPAVYRGWIKAGDVKPAQ